jgi:site-specific recombinase XerD
VKPNVSIVLDIRRKKRSNLFPAKLRIYDPMTKVAKMYEIGMSFCANDFQKVYGAKKPKPGFEEDHKRLIEFHAKAIAVIQEMKVFRFQIFEEKMFRHKGDGTNMMYYFDRRIREFTANNQVSSRDIYSSCKTMIERYLEHLNKGTEKLPFIDITPKWLQRFEDYMLSRKKSLTTVSIYTRAIQAVFNLAIENHDIDADIYPFGRRNYKRPHVKRVKKALTKEQLLELWNAKPQNIYQEKARDFWFFSFASAGMNMKDISMLKWKNVRDGKIVYVRSKTAGTSRSEVEEINIPITDIAQGILNKYGTQEKKADQYVFSILCDELSELDKIRAYRKFTRFVNQHIQKLAKTVNLPSGLSTNWGRHSFSTKGIREGYSMEMIGEALNHSDIKVTQGYFQGLEDIPKDEMIRKITKIS